MNIVFIARSYIDEYLGGASVYYTQLAKYFYKFGCVVHILVGTHNKSKKGVFRKEGVYIHKIFLKYNNSLFNYIYRNWAYAKELRKICNKIKIDLLNIQEAGFLLFIKKNLFLRKIPVVYTFHAPVHYEVIYDYIKMKNQWNGIEKIQKYLKMKAQYFKFKLAEYSDLSYARRIIVMSNFVKNNVRRIYGERYMRNLKVYPIGVDQELYSPVNNKYSLRKKMNIDPEKICFFTLRRLEPRMGLEKLLCAIKLIIEERITNNLHFLIGGTGVLKDRLVSLAKKLEISGYISFLDYISDKDKNSYYQVSDCFILPSEELEGFGIVTIEALSCNLPVIATSIGASPEILNKINPELVINGVEASDIAEKIIYFLNNYDFYHGNLKFSEYAKKHYDWKLISKNLIDEYKLVANERGC